MFVVVRTKSHVNVILIVFNIILITLLALFCFYCKMTYSICLIRSAWVFGSCRNHSAYLSYDSQ